TTRTAYGRCEERCARQRLRRRRCREQSRPGACQDDTGTMLIRTGAVPPFFKNGYLVVCETTKEAVLIDPGDEVDALLDEAKAMGAKIGAILLTHAHLDHV